MYLEDHFYKWTLKPQKIVPLYIIFFLKMLRVEERGKLFQFKVNMCYVSNMYAEITGQIITKPQSP